MDRWYELMDLDTANVVGFYETQEDVLAMVRNAFERYGRTGVLDLALSENAADGSGVLVADGEELMRLALRASPRVVDRNPDDR